MICIDAENLRDGLYNIKNGKIYKYKAKGGTIRSYELRNIVTCGECVKANTEDCSHSYWDDDWGEWRVGYKGDDWFCADGEREGE